MSTTASEGRPLTAGIVKRRLPAAALFFLFAAGIFFGGREIPARTPSVYARVLPSGAGPTLIPVQKVRVVKTYPHDPGAFTQGLIFLDGRLFESTGLTGKSGIREVDLETGRVIRKADLPAPYFGEGLTEWQGDFILLTWHSGKGFVIGRSDFKVRREFSYAGEGWGIAHDGKNLIMSNGTSRLNFLEPRTFAVERTLEVTASGKPVRRLNELEFIRGEIYANIWLSDVVARISPKTGQVLGWIDLSALRGLLPRGSEAEALNGIAYDEQGDRIFVTGKYWPNLFEIELTGSEK